jgi:hypothetical protein
MTTERKDHRPEPTPPPEPAEATERPRPPEASEPDLEHKTDWEDHHDE